MNRPASADVAPSSPATGTDDARWARAFGWLLVGCLAVRLAYAAVFPLDLAPDESYYWDWGRRPDLGYYSKPPMIGWLMAIAGRLGNDTFVALKLAPALLATLALVPLYLLGRDMDGARTGFWSAALFAATPANAALATFFTIDPPLTLCWCTSLWLTWRWWTRGSDHPRHLLPLALVLGGGYLTKQMHLAFPVLLLAFLALARSHPPTRTRMPWKPAILLILASLLLLSPPLLWNWQHDWITLRHTAEELEHRPLDLARRLRFLGEFLGGQAALGGGLTWGLMVAALVTSLRQWPHLEDRYRFLLIFSAPGLAVFLGLATTHRLEQNWPLVFYPALTVLVASGRPWRRPRPSLPGPGWLPLAASLGGTLAVALMTVPFVLPSSAIAGSRTDATARLRGWQTLATEVAAFRQGVPRPDHTFLLTFRDRSVASTLAFYLPDHPRTYAWEDPQHPRSQYGIWGLPTDKAGGDALVIQRVPLAVGFETLAECFDRWTPLGEFTIRLGPHPDRDRRYAVFLGEGFRPSRPAVVPSSRPMENGAKPSARFIHLNSKQQRTMALTHRGRFLDWLPLDHESHILGAQL